MNRHLKYLPLAAAILLLGAAAPAARADSDSDSDSDSGAEEIPFDVANVFFELNDTDGDLGIHALIDGEPWKSLSIETPDERENLQIRLRGRLRRQGLTELFFESAEPTFDELAPEDFFARFPEGEYEVEGTTLEGDELESTSTVTHLMPAPADGFEVNGMALPEDCDEDPVPAVSEPVTVGWDPVTLSHPDLGRSGEPIVVDRYQLVLEREEGDLLKLTFDLSPGVTEVDLPEGLVEPGDEIKIEILTREASGNQTATESCFEVD